MVAIIAPHLTLGTTLRDLKAYAAAGLVVIPVAKELPQHLSAEVSGRMALLGEFPRLVLAL